jgi:hypothetical protein
MVNEEREDSSLHHIIMNNNHMENNDDILDLKTNYGNAGLPIQMINDLTEQLPEVEIKIDLKPK